MSDTGITMPEGRQTLLYQRQQLLLGLRLAQMFPAGTSELPVPEDYARVTTARGAFHFNPNRISDKEVIRYSKEARENVLLGLGPYNKVDVLEWVRAGERLVALVEEMPNGVEVKCAIGTRSTIPAQWLAFEYGKLPDSIIHVKEVREALLQRRLGRNPWH